MPRSLASKKSVVAGERDRPDVARRRAQWVKHQGRVEAERLVFIDETWTRTDMAPLRGWALFPSKYSPDLNPIEQVFAKLKHLLRKAAARTVDTVCTAIGEVLDAFTPEECANYLKNSGYRAETGCPAPGYQINSFRNCVRLETILNTRLKRAI